MDLEEQLPDLLPDDIKLFLSRQQLWTGIKPLNSLNAHILINGSLKCDQQIYSSIPYPGLNLYGLCSMKVAVFVGRRDHVHEEMKFGSRFLRF